MTNVENYKTKSKLNVDQLINDKSIIFVAKEEFENGRKEREKKIGTKYNT